MKHTGTRSNDPGNVADALLAMIIPTAFYWGEPRKAPASWSVLFTNSTCHSETPLQDLTLNIERNCIFRAITLTGANAIDKESLEVYTFAHLFNSLPPEEKKDTQYRTAMGLYIMSMQRHFMCGYFGYLTGWIVAMSTNERG